VTDRPKLKRKNPARPGRPPKRVSGRTNPALALSPEDRKHRKAARRIRDDAFVGELMNRPLPPRRRPRVGSSIVWQAPRLQAFIADWVKEHPGESVHRRGVKIGDRIRKRELAESLIEHYRSGATIDAVVFALRGVESFLKQAVDTPAAAERWRPLLTALKKPAN
jgi:hypothetical protein